LAPPETERLRIERLGHRGDGIASSRAGSVYVPFTLPGETVLVERAGDRARIVEILAPSPARIAPLCPHFGACGGCSVQHLRRHNYVDWKMELVRTALTQRGLDIPVDRPAVFPAHSRRRALFTARRTGKGIVFGYNERQSHRIVPVSECPVLLPQIEKALPVLAAWLTPLIPLKAAIRIAVTATSTGLDVALEGPKPRPPAIAAEVAARRPSGLDIARLSVAGEPVLVTVDPAVDISGVSVILPPLAFLQAVEAAEAAMARLVIGWVGGTSRVADLFSGIGTFSLRLARELPVVAVERDRAALDALAEAARRTQGLKPVETLRRDLERQPLSAGELERFDGLVFDPPRAGARAQAEEIARSSVARVAAVSCNPATLARDLRILVDGGYRLCRVVPVDQFLYSPHIEAVALLEREAER
jgi:23S rRNA (uracil1939-C5)-methyltransferase